MQGELVAQAQEGEDGGGFQVRGAGVEGGLVVCDSGFVDVSGVSDNSLNLRTKPSALQSSND